MNNMLAETTHTLSKSGGAFRGYAGTWTEGLSAQGVPTLAKAAAAETGRAIYEPDLGARDQAAESGKGVSLTQVVVTYTVATADATDVRAELVQYDYTPAAGSPPTRTVIAGDDNAHYDDASNTAAERGAQGVAKKATITVPTPAYLDDGLGYAVEFVVVDPGTSEVTLLGCQIVTAQTPLTFSAS